MKKYILIFSSALLVALFIALAISRSNLSSSSEKRQSVRTIVPSEKNTITENTLPTDDSMVYDESKTQPLIALESDETFLQALNVDLNNDEIPDQICAIKKTAEPNIYLVPGIQNRVTGEYVRLTGIRTGITQTRTLLFYTMDIIGDRTNALIYSGMTADNIQLLAVYVPTLGVEGKLSFLAVADLRSDGSITIQEIKRSDAYNMGLTNGESYPIYTYNSDPDAPQALDQIERIYRWNKTLKRYEQVSESKIAGKKIETQLIRHLQSGDLGTFENFLEGLWYMNDATSQSNTKHLFFNIKDNEIVFHNGSTEELYVRESGAPRRYGAYLITRNQSIPSIRRLIDIELTGIDEIRLKILEDVKLKIGVASDWDGVYRKMSSTASIPKTDAEQMVEQLKAMLNSSGNDWVSSDGQKFQTMSTKYSLTGSEGTETGMFIVMRVKDRPVIQFKPDTPAAKAEFYLAEVQRRENAGEAKQTLSLTKVSVSMDGIQLAGSPPIIFERTK